MAAQLTATKGLRARGEPATRDLATSSLPVPDSPVMSTVHLVSATCDSTASTGPITGSLPSSQGAVRFAPAEGIVAARVAVTEAAGPAALR
jgi:hypothetical protein